MEELNEVYLEYLREKNLDDLWQDMKNRQNEAIERIPQLLNHYKRGLLSYKEVVQQINRDYEFYMKSVKTYSDCYKVQH